MTMQCEWCKRVMPPRQHGGGEPKTYCSRKCKNAAWHVSRREHRASYHMANRDRRVAQMREWWRLNHERALESKRVYREQRRSELSMKQLAYYRAHPQQHITAAHRRRARQLGNGGSHTTQEWLEKCALLGNVCIYCGEAKPLTRDHKVPLRRGGTNDIDNIVPACHSCNCRKGTRTAVEFLSLGVR